MDSGTTAAASADAPTTTDLAEQALAYAAGEPITPGKKAALVANGLAGEIVEHEPQQIEHGSR